MIIVLGKRDAVDRAAKEKVKGKTDKEIADLLSGQGFKPTDVDTAVNQSRNINRQGEDPFFMGGMPDDRNEQIYTPEAPPMSDDAELEPPSPEDYEAELRGEKRPVKKQLVQTELPEIQVLQDRRSGGFEQVQSSMGSQEMIHQIAEKVVYEKWDELMGSIGDIIIWKSSMERDLKSVKQELLRVSARLDNVQNSVLGKVREYGEGLSTVSSEIQALEGVLSKILEPLTENIKELSKITIKLKK